MIGRSVVWVGRSQNEACLTMMACLGHRGDSYGFSLWRRGALSILVRGFPWLQFVVGGWWSPVPEARGPKDWAVSVGPLHIIRGDWWASRREVVS